MPHTVAETAMAENDPVLVGERSVSSWQRERRFALLLHGGFLLIGVVTTLLGPILPLLAAKWHLGDAEAGWLFTAQFTGGILGSALASQMILRFGLLRLMAGGYAVTAVGVACLGISSWGFGLLSVLGYGMALGLIAPAINLLVAEINSGRQAAALNILNFVWALGAVAGPPMIAFFARDGRLVVPLVGLAVLLACVGFLIARRAFVESSPGRHRQTLDGKDAAGFEGSPLGAWTTPYALLTGALIFIYVGTETAASGWIATYALRLGASTAAFGTMTPSVFWAGLLLGRAVAPTVLTRVSDTALVLLGLIIAGAGLLIVLAGTNLISVTFGIGLTGLGLASIFPTTFAIFTRHFEDLAPQLTGLFFVFGGVGGAVIPWLVGFVSERFGDLRVGLLVPSIGVASMIALQICIMRVLAQRH
jgi:MFS transporter, FHS family, glucose/mannose:H+ symporter